MAKITDIAPELLQFTEGAAPSTPSAGVVRLYAKDDGLLYSKDDAGVEIQVSGGSGGGTSDPIELTLQAAPSAPAEGKVYIYAKTDGMIYSKTSDSPIESPLSNYAPNLFSLFTEVPGSLGQAPSGKVAIYAMNGQIYSTDDAGNEIILGTESALEDDLDIYVGYTTELTGTISVVEGTTAVTGVGTLFTSELAPGDIIFHEYGLLPVAIASIESDTALTLSWEADTQGSSSGFQFSKASLGNDSNDGTAATAENALATISAALNKVPKNINATVTIYLVPGDYGYPVSDPIYLKDISGSGKIIITGLEGSETYLEDGVKVENCLVPIEIKYLFIGPASDIFGGNFRNSSYIHMEHCRIAGTTYGLQLINSNVYLHWCNGDNLIDTFDFDSSSHVTSIGCLFDSTYLFAFDSEFRTDKPYYNYSVGNIITSEDASYLQVPNGYCIFNTTLGKPMWYNGTNWVDATGAILL